MKIITGILIVTVLFSACKKDDNPSSSSSGGRLKKIEEVFGGDSTTVTFNYDANNRLSFYRFLTSGSGSIDSFSTTITRDAGGRIIQLVEIEDAYPPMITNITYNGTSSQLKSQVTNYSVNYKDSVAYTYSGNNITELQYYLDPSSGIYTYSGKTEYTVQNGNVVTIKEYDISTGAVESQSNITYDAKSPAMTRTIEEGLITDLFELGFANNILKMDSIYPSSPSDNETVTLTYTYATSGQPSAAAILVTPGITGSIKYYYQ